MIPTILQVLKKFKMFLYGLTEKQKMLFLLLYGISFFIYFFHSHYFSGTENIMSSRLNSMSIAIDSFFNGHHLLSGIDSAGNVISIGGSDDRGMYIMVPIVAKLFGITNPVTAYAFFQKIMVFSVLLFYPIMFYFIFRSMLISLILPLIVTAQFVVFHQFTDGHWVQQWVLLIAIPILWILWKHPWQNKFIILVFIIGLASSVSNSIRSYSGLGVSISAAVFIF